MNGAREALRQLLRPGPFCDSALELCMPREGETLVDATWRALEALVGVTLLIRVADFRPTLERPQDGAAFHLRDPAPTGSHERP